MRDRKGKYVYTIFTMTVNSSFNINGHSTGYIKVLSSRLIGEMKIMLK